MIEKIARTRLYWAPGIIREFWDSSRKGSTHCRLLVAESSVSQEPMVDLAARLDPIRA